MAEPPEDVLYEDVISVPVSPLIPRLPSLASDPGGSSQQDETSFSVDGDTEMDLDTSQSGPRPSVESVQAFEQCLLASPCPNCKNSSSPLTGDARSGIVCKMCGWNIPVDILRPLELAFAGHHG